MVDKTRKRPEVKYATRKEIRDALIGKAPGIFAVHTNGRISTIAEARAAARTHEETTPLKLPQRWF